MGSYNEYFYGSGMIMGVYSELKFFWINYWCRIIVVVISVVVLMRNFIWVFLLFGFC